MQVPLAIPGNRAFDAVGFGLNAVDHLIVVERYPALESKTRLREQQHTTGGQAATTMVALTRLGLRTAYAGRFGSDQEGQFGFQSLREEGVDLQLAEVVSGARNQIAFIIIDARSGERTIIWDRDESLAYSARDAPTSLAAQGRVLHLDAHDPPACSQLAQAARAAGTIVSADIDSIYPGLAELLPLLDVLIASKDFPKRFTGISDERTSLMELKMRFGCPVIGMTLGTRGAMVYCQEGFVESPAYEVPGSCRDTTGAGDAFRGGFLYGLLTGADLETTLKIANAVAALKCRKLGARTALPSKQDLAEFLTSARALQYPANS
ncbi:MAG TPA: carbohydrate kinase family protein [Pyrinomonadaceae bacterium]|nr:carbohydrate kinase family protein [Pyrinomonadaceae bacterium]